MVLAPILFSGGLETTSPRDEGADDISMPNVASILGGAMPGSVAKTEGLGCREAKLRPTFHIRGLFVAILLTCEELKMARVMDYM